MEFISKPAIEITTLALDGLAARHKVLSSNVANADTPGYKRSDVRFEDQLRNIIQKEDNKSLMRTMGVSYNPGSIDFVLNNNLTGANASGNINMKDNDYENFTPEYYSTDDPAVKTNGNNVSIEYEMSELAKNGTMYTALTTLQEKAFRGLGEVIKGGGI